MSVGDEEGFIQPIFKFFIIENQMMLYLKFKQKKMRQPRQAPMISDT